MSQENVEILRQGYEALSRGDVDAVLEICDPDVEFHLPEGGINTGTLRGHRALKEFLEGYIDAFEPFRMEPERFLEADDQVVVVLRVVGRGRGSGLEVDVRPAHLWTMDSGRAVRIQAFTESEHGAALDAAGLSEWPMSEQNVEIVRRMLEAWRLGAERDDPAAVFESGTVAADLEWIPSRGFPGPRSYRSREGVVEYFRTWTEGFDGWSFEIERLIEAPGDRVVALVHQTATGKGSGASVEMDTGFVYELEAGQVIRIRNYLDLAEALEAAGLSE